MLPLPTQPKIDVSALPAAGGTVSGGGAFPAGSSQTVTATPNVGYAFVSWQEFGDVPPVAPYASVVSTSPSFTFQLNAYRRLVANFTAQNYSIAVSASPGADGTVGGACSACPAGSSQTVRYAEQRLRVCQLDRERQLVSTSASYSFTLNANRALVANFVAALTLAATPSSTTQVGQSYSQTNAASGGTAPYTYSISSGALPAGASLDSSTGTVSGTLIAAGAFSYAIMATDSGNPQQTATAASSGTIAPAPLKVIATPSATTQVGQSYRRSMSRAAA